MVRTSLSFVCFLVIGLLVAMPAAGQDVEAPPDSPAEDSEEPAPEDAPAPDEPAPDAPPPDAPPPDEPLEEPEEGIDTVEPDETVAPMPEGMGLDDFDIDEELLELEGITVTHTQEDVFQVGGSVQLIDEEFLDTFEMNDPHDVVTQVPGLYVRGEDGYGLRPNIGMRGANAERSKKLTLMEDGILFGPAPYAAPAAYYFPLMARMVGVEVFKGPAAIRYGPNTIGGAINFISRDVPSEEEAGAEVAVGTNLYGDLHLYYGNATDWGGFLVEGVHLRTDGFKELDWGGDDTGFQRTEIVTRGRLQSDPAEFVFHRLELTLGLSLEDSNETYLGLTDADFAADPYRRYGASSRDRMEWWRTKVALRYAVTAGDHLDLTATLYRHDFSRSWRKVNRFRDGPPLDAILADPTSGTRQVFYRILTGEENSASEAEALMLGTNARDFVSQGVDLHGQLRLGEEPVSHVVDVGVRLHNDSIERNHTEDPFLVEDRSLVPEGTDTITTTRNRGEALALAAFAAYGIEVHGLTVTPGVRLEVIRTDFNDRLADRETTNVDSVILPGIGAQYEIGGGFGVLAGVHRGFSPVAPGQPAVVEPELSTNYEVGARYFDQEQGTVAEVIGFYNDYENLTGECTFSSGCREELVDRQFNGGEVRVLGVEALASHAFDLGNEFTLPARLSYTFTDTSFLTSFSSDNPQFGEVVEGDELPYVPNHQAALRLGVAREPWSVDAKATYLGEMREQAGEGDEGPLTDRYVMVDLVGQYEVFPRGTVYVKLQNVLNAQPVASRRPFGARPARPFEARVGFEYEL